MDLKQISKKACNAKPCDHQIYLQIILNYIFLNNDSFVTS